MSPGMSSEFRTGQYQFATPAATETTPTQTAASADSAGRSGRKSLFSGFPNVLMVLFVVLLVAIGIALIRSGWRGARGPGEPGPFRTARPAAIAATPGPTNTVISVAADCPLDCVNPEVVATRAVTQPEAIILAYPVAYEQVVNIPVPYPVPVGYDPGRYEPVTFGGASCPSQSVYVVRPGDTVLHLSRWFGVDPHAIVEANGLWNPDYIQIGQVLSIPCAPANWQGLP